MKSLEKQLELPGIEKTKKQKMTLLEKIAIGVVSSVASAIVAGTIAIGVITYKYTPEPLLPPQGDYIFSYEEWLPTVEYNGYDDKPAMDKARKIIQNPELAYSLLPKDEQEMIDKDFEKTPSKFDEFLTMLFTGGCHDPKTRYECIYGVKDYELNRNDLSTRIIRHLHVKYVLERKLKEETKQLSK
jgi:hypothetical protein